MYNWDIDDKFDGDDDNVVCCLLFAAAVSLHAFDGKSLSQGTP